MCISLEGISNEELAGRLKSLVRKEKELTHRIVLHLAEVDKRRLYAELGYTSLYDYATRGLGYGGSSAQRRIIAARALARVPEVYELLETGKMSLAVVEVVSNVLTASNAREVLRDVSGKSKDEALSVIASYGQQESLFDTEENTEYLRAEVFTKPVENQQYKICFAAGAEFVRKLERAKELMFVPGMDTATLFETLLNDYLQRHCPEERQRRRIAKEKRRQARRDRQTVQAIGQIQEVAEEIVQLMPEKDLADSRYIPRQLRDEILCRDGHCCSYVAPDGTRCETRVGLQIDHIVPWAVGGRTDAENLRAVCKTHNLMYARKIFGDEHIDQIIANRKLGIRNPFDNAEELV